MKKKKMPRVIAALCMAAMILLLSISIAFAAENTEYQLNGQTVKNGDTVTYVLRLTGLNKKVAGINVTVEYDDEHLSIMKDTVNLPVFTDAVCNTAQEGMVLFNAANAMNGYEVKDDSIIFSASFQIKSTGGSLSDIDGKVTELYDMDANELASDQYKIDASVIEGTLPSVVTPQDVEERIAEAKKNGAGEQENPEDSVNIWIIIGGAAVLLCIAAAGVIIMVRRSNGKAVPETSKQAGDGAEPVKTDVEPEENNKEE